MDRQYTTQYARSYGNGRTFANAGLAATQPLAPTLRQPMPVYETQAPPQMEQQTLYDYGAQEPARELEWPYSTEGFPQHVSVPTKKEFYPQGFRLGYAKGRKTFQKTAQFMSDPQRPPAINFPSQTYTQQQSSEGYGKRSVSQRMPAVYQRRYNVPGYMGFVKNIQHHHGNTYGRTTRECMMN